MPRVFRLLILVLSVVLAQAGPAAAQSSNGQAPNSLLPVSSSPDSSLPASQVSQSSILGAWLTQNGDGVVVIAPCGIDICGRLAGFFLDHQSDPTPVDHRGVSQCDLPLINSARLIRPNLWKGHITDPRNGNVYGAELHLNPRGALVLRGYFGLPLFGESQTWTRYTGWLPANCRIIPAALPGNR
jgi:uncharacterized protein (DUF2147 family)